MNPATSFLDDALARDLAERFATPFYVYDLRTVAAQLSAFSGFDTVRYAIKANPNLAVLSTLRQAGAEVDSVSAGEVHRALAAGFRPEQIIYTADLLDRDAAATIKEHGLHVNAGSLTMIDQVAAIGASDSITLRINPGFGDGHDPKVTTGGPQSKHGIWHELLGEAAERADAGGLRVTGLHVHIGSGVGTDRLHDTIASMDAAVAQFESTIATVSTGGGMSVPYREGDAEYDIAAMASAWSEARNRWSQRVGRSISLEVEPGRYLVARAGVLVTEVCGLNERSGSDPFVLVDAGFHTLARPTFYGAYHRITAPGKSTLATRPTMVAGPLCESADVFTQKKGGVPDPRPLPDLVAGDLLVIHDAGAYGASMASCYNSRPLPAEVVLTSDGVAHLAKPALDLAELIRAERAALPPTLQP